VAEPADQQGKKEFSPPPTFGLGAWSGECPVSMREEYIALLKRKTQNHDHHEEQKRTHALPNVGTRGDWSQPKRAREPTVFCKKDGLGQQTRRYPVGGRAHDADRPGQIVLKPERETLAATGKKEHTTYTLQSMYKKLTPQGQHARGLGGRCFYKPACIYGCEEKIYRATEKEREALRWVWETDNFRLSREKASDGDRGKPTPSHSQEGEKSRNNQQTCVGNHQLEASFPLKRESSGERRRQKGTVSIS